MNIGVVGSRRRNTGKDYRICKDTVLGFWSQGDILVSGGCPQGGDHFAHTLAKEHGLSILIHYPDWNGPDKLKAGFIRNSKIVESSDIIIALVTSDRKGGTEDTVKKAQALGKKVVFI